MYVCMYVCMYLSMYLCIYVSMYLCMYLNKKYIFNNLHFEEHECKNTGRPTGTFLLLLLLLFSGGTSRLRTLFIPQFDLIRYEGIPEAFSVYIAH